MVVDLKNKESSTTSFRINHDLNFASRCATKDSASSFHFEILISLLMRTGTKATHGICFGGFA